MLLLISLGECFFIFGVDQLAKVDKGRSLVIQLAFIFVFLK